MRVTAEATDVITTINGRPTRVWRAQTEHGVACLMFVAHIVVPVDEDQSQFEAELQTMPVPREVALQQVLDLRLLN